MYKINNPQTIIPAEISYLKVCISGTELFLPKLTCCGRGWVDMHVHMEDEWERLGLQLMSGTSMDKTDA